MDLELALAIEDETERMLSVVAVIADAVRDLGYTPVIVGGLAVQFWTYSPPRVRRTGHRDAASQAVSLYLSSELDRKRLEERAAQEALTPSLAELIRLAERIQRGERVETWDLHDIARKLR
jgi:hypothetical protein